MPGRTDFRPCGERGAGILTPTIAFERLLVALLVGFLIGLDRERAELRKAHHLFAGVRTFPLIAVSGALPMLAGGALGTWLVVAVFLAVAGVVLISYARTSVGGHVGATTEIAAFVTFLLGVLSGAGEVFVAGGAGIAVAILLAAKPRLQTFSRALSSEEITAVLELAVISCIVLPLLPNRAYGPWQALNPFEIWLMVVLVSAVSFAGFVAMRLFGEDRGLGMTGVIGGVASSTAVTLALADRTRADVTIARPAAAAAALASSVMCVRVAVLAAASGPGILPRLLPVIVAMALAGAGVAWFVGRRAAAEPAGAAARMSNPFSLKAAVTFGLVYAVVLLVVRGASFRYGAAGMFLAAALSSLADVDAVSIAFSRGGPLLDGWRGPAAAVSIALVGNTLVKLGIALAAGRGRFRIYAAGALATVALVGSVAAAGVYAAWP